MNSQILEKNEVRNIDLFLVAAAAAASQPVGSIEDFAPDEGLDASFLEDTKDMKDYTTTSNAIAETSDR